MQEAEKKYDKYNGRINSLPKKILIILNSVTYKNNKAKIN